MFKDYQKLMLDLFKTWEKENATLYQVSFPTTNKEEVKYLASNDGKWIVPLHDCHLVGNAYVYVEPMTGDRIVINNYQILNETEENPIHRKIWSVYLLNFDEANRRKNNCNCCRSFMRKYGNIVKLNEDGSFTSIFDIDIDKPELKEYAKSVKAVRDLIHSLPITDRFFAESTQLGQPTTDDYFSLKRKGDVITNYDHLCGKVSQKHVTPKDQIAPKKAFYRDIMFSAKRAAKEISVESIDTVLDLIEQNVLYRGNEVKFKLVAFKDFLVKFNNTPQDKRNSLLWSETDRMGAEISTIRTSAIGKLLENLTEGGLNDENVQRSLNAYETMVAPSNYRRPTAQVTPAMVEKARKALEESGVLETLERRTVVESDLHVSNLLYTEPGKVSSFFDKIAEELPVNPNSLKPTEIDSKKFIEEILPKAQKLELFFGENLQNNLMTLVTSKYNSKGLFKWSEPNDPNGLFNNFGWDYTGGVTDAIRERVKQMGGKVDGVLRFTAIWNEEGVENNLSSPPDLDIHCTIYQNDKHVDHIYFGAPRGNKGNSGWLDVDMRGRPNEANVENITFDTHAALQSGNKYVFSINNFNNRHHVGCRVQLQINGEVHTVAYNRMVPFYNHYVEKLIVVTVHKQANGTLSFTWGGDFKSNSSTSTTNVSSNSVWGLKTNTFVPVKFVMNSPNHWEQNKNKVGLKHTFFIVDSQKIKRDSASNVRGIYNEYLDNSFNEHRKALELIGAKYPVERSADELSGIGVSDATSDSKPSVILRVTDGSTRVYKVNF